MLNPGEFGTTRSTIASYSRQQCVGVSDAEDSLEPDESKSRELRASRSRVNISEGLPYSRYGMCLEMPFAPAY